MNDQGPLSDPELDRLFAAARRVRPETSRAEFAFETRLLAQLRAGRDSIGLWGWRLVPWFAAVVGLLAVANGLGLGDAVPMPDEFSEWLMARMLPVV